MKLYRITPDRLIFRRSNNAMSDHNGEKLLIIEENDYTALTDTSKNIVVQ